MWQGWSGYRVIRKASGISIKNILFNRANTVADTAPIRCQNVCVCAREGGRERESVGSVCMCVCACVCVCVCESESERERERSTLTTLL